LEEAAIAGASVGAVMKACPQEREQPAGLKLSQKSREKERNKKSKMVKSTQIARLDGESLSAVFGMSLGKEG
jgi:hypothetical protein